MPEQRSPSGGTYRVQRGDTLYSIAFRHGLDYRELADWNGIPSPYTIYPGRELRLAAGLQPLREDRVDAVGAGEVQHAAMMPPGGAIDKGSP